MSTSPIPTSTSTPGTGSVLGSGSTSATNNSTPAGGALGETQFLSLLMTQMQDQDPLDPSDPTQYMTELAQFTSVEQETNMAGYTSQLSAAQNAGDAIALIGHTVTYPDPTTGASTSGTVQSVQFGSSGPTLTINGTAGISLSGINQVQ